MRTIPQKLKDEMSSDLFYKKCCVTGRSDEKIEWHHNFTWKGRDLQEKWCILPLLKSVHKDIVQYKEYCDWIMLNRADEETLKKYSKAVDLIHKRNYLNTLGYE